MRGEGLATGTGPDERRRRRRRGAAGSQGDTAFRNGCRLAVSCPACFLLALSPRTPAPSDRRRSRWPRRARERGARAAARPQRVDAHGCAGVPWFQTVHTCRPNAPTPNRSAQQLQPLARAASARRPSGRRPSPPPPAPPPAAPPSAAERVLRAPHRAKHLPLGRARRRAHGRADLRVPRPQEGVGVQLVAQQRRHRRLALR